MNIREELEYIWDEIKRVPMRIREYIEFLKRWLSYFKVLRRAYDFDYSSILDAEKHQITRVRDCITYYHNHVNWEQDVNRMNLAISLLEIIERDGDIKFIKDSDKWVCTVYVNTRNAARYNKYIAYRLNETNDNVCREFLKADLYTEKAWQLYYKLRAQYTRSWWD